MSVSKARAAKAESGATDAEGKGSARRQELLRIAAETFADLGYSRTRIRDLAERAKILNGSLYHHFPSKEAMLDELLRPYFDELIPLNERVMNSPQSAPDKMLELVRETVLHAAQRRSEVAILQKDWDYLVSLFPYVAEGIRHSERIWLKLLNEGVASGDFRDDLDAKVIYRTMRGAMWGVSQWYRPTGQLKIDAIAEAQAQLFLAGFSAQKRRATRR